MSRLDDLIQEYCPDGVEYKTLSEIFDTRNGYTPSKSNKENWTNGEIPWFVMEDIRKSGNILSNSIHHVSKQGVKGNLFPENSIIVATSATIGEHALITVPSLANQRFTYLMLKEEFKEQFDIKFLYYYCYKLDEWCLNHLNQGSFASVDMKQFVKFTFPLPALPVQREIVRILDEFTLLSAELAAELAARKKQYEYYRDELLTFGDEIEWKTLDGKNGIAVIKGGKDYKHLGEGTVPIYGSGGIMGSCDTSIYNKPTVLIPRKGSISNIFYVDGPFWNVDTIFYTEINDNVIMPKFLFHWICNYHVEKLNTSNAARPALTREILKGVPVPIPSMEEQQKIVRALDTFENVCTDMLAGLPAEIEARQKQYEYYRDKLLTFKELK